MLTLGVHDGHTATACLMEDGKVLACVSEERLVREKEKSGFPEKAIRECLRLAERAPEEIQRVGICSLMPQIGAAGWRRPGWHKRAFGLAVKVLPKRLLQNPSNVNYVQGLSSRLFSARRKDLLARLDQMGISSSKAEFYEHHLCHAATTYYKNWNRNEKTLVITLDGSGDAVCATVNIGEGGRLKRISETFNYNSICDFYTYVTTYLGMKPMSHEYKVMGLAPYASNYGRSRVREVFQSYYQIDPDDPLQIINTSGAWKWQFYDRLRKDIGLARFDIVAGALQEVFEEVVIEWIKNAIRHTGIGDLALSGGGFMNVKLNSRIADLSEVSSLFIFPSCGDESNPLGAAILAALDGGLAPDSIEPLGMVYWGASYDNEAVEKAIDNLLAGKGMIVSREDDINACIAQRIADGKVVGRMVGRMEWGARALGNRSIIADPRQPQIIHKINKAIKMRDFWMPFAPAILESYRDKYVKLRKDYKSPFMTVAPETHEAAWEAIPAGLHPFDRTARCQIVDPVNHPSFHDLISKFEAITGVGGVLNTSFNLHGEAIVMTPEDAIHTFLNSDLDVLQMEDFIVEKQAGRVA
jgi:carbamoyltransferase